MKLQTIMMTLATCALAGVLAAQSAPEAKKPAQEKVKVKLAAPTPPKAPLPSKAPMPPKAGQVKVAPLPPSKSHGMTVESADGIFVIQGDKAAAPKKVDIKKIETKDGTSTTIMSKDGQFTVTLDGECCDDAKCEVKAKKEACGDECDDACKSECEIECEVKCDVACEDAKDCDDECSDCDDCEECEIECEIADATGGMGLLSLKLDDVSGGMPAMIELDEMSGELKDLAIAFDDITVAGPEGKDIKAIVRDAVKNLGVHVNGEKVTRDNLPKMLLSRVAEGGPCNIEISIKINGHEIKLPLDRCPLFAKMHGGSCCESTSPSCTGGACAPAPAPKCDGCCPCEGQAKKSVVNVLAAPSKPKVNIAGPKHKSGPVRVIEVAPKKVQKKVAAPAPKKLELGNCDDGSCAPQTHDFVISAPKGQHVISTSPMVLHRELKTSPAPSAKPRVMTHTSVAPPKKMVEVKKPMAGATAKSDPKSDASLRARVAELASRVASLKADIDRLQDLFDLRSK